jgi:crotonobetainyl-CoA:carnitine CoA-transferase CaiB-like acyl-CoA transferase
MTEAPLPGALEGVRVLDLTDEAAVYAVKLLADLGADVLRVEPPSGGRLRRRPPFARDVPSVEGSLHFLNMVTSRRGVTLDPATRDGARLLERLLAGTHILVTDWPFAGIPEPRAALTMRPSLVFVSVSAYGYELAGSGSPPSDLVAWATAGTMTLAGFPEDPPNAAHMQAYYAGSIAAAQGALLAFAHAEATGEGQFVDVSLQESLALAQETAQLLWDMQGFLRRRQGEVGSLPIKLPGVGTYACADGHVYLGVSNRAGSPWSAFLGWLTEEGFAENLNEEPYCSLVERLSTTFLREIYTSPGLQEEVLPHFAHLDSVVRRFCAAHTMRWLYEEGQKRRFMVGPAFTARDLVESEQLAARGWYQRVERGGGSLTYPGPPYRLAETPAGIRKPPPRLGEHNVEVYCGELGLSIDELQALKAAGVV